jgi:hypothetical protein
MVVLPIGRCDNDRAVYVYEHFIAEATTKALCAWAQAPCLAPDNAEKLRRHPLLRSFADVTVNPLEADAVADSTHLQQRVHELERELSKMRGSKLFRLHSAASRLKRQLAG